MRYVWGFALSLVLAGLAGLVYGFLLSWPVIPAIIAQFVAIGVGFAASIGVSISTRQRNAGLGVLAALAALFGILVGEVVGVNSRIPDLAEQLTKDGSMVEVVALYAVLRDEGASTSMLLVEVGKGAIGFSLDDACLAGLSEEASAALDKKIESKVSELRAKDTETRKLFTELLKDRLTIGQRLRLGVDFYTYIFGGVAVFFAWYMLKSED